jgi:phage replisome organizer, putative, N-terminal region
MDDKKYYWLKLKRDFFKRHDIQIIEDMPNGKDYILFYLKLLCESVDHEGNLRFSDAIPYNEQMLATITRTNIDIVRSAVKVFTELQMMEVLDDGTIFMCEVDKMIGSESYWASQKRLQRQANSVQLDNHWTMSRQSPTCPGKSKSIEIEKDKELDIKKNTKRKYFENENVNSIFLDFLEMRKKMKAVNSDRAINGLINILNKYNDETKIQMINNSILNSWKSVYELKQNEKKKESSDWNKNLLKMLQMALISFK